MPQTLVVGGTGFLGAEIVRALHDAGHAVTTLTRRLAPHPGIASLSADRFGPLDALKGRHFDHVFDTCAYIPEAVTHLLDALTAPPDRYVMVSSVSAYPDFSTSARAESDEVPTATEDDLAPYRAVPFADRGRVPMNPESYGPLKRACELAATDRLGPAAILLRAGLIVGAGDRSDRLTWWVRRIDQGGRIPVPQDRPIQCIDVRDLAGFAVHAAASGASGVFNVTSQPFPLAILLDTTRALSGSDATFVPLSDETLLNAGIGPWMNLPLWLPDTPEYRHFFAVPTLRASAAGLRIRPLADTLQPLLEWDRTRRDIALQCGLTAGQEAALLA
jgi:2'-hydroxyisoflavone reductase